jgi:phospholipid/cholesterol/gamma-HCH transport system substrate-binding protein
MEPEKRYFLEGLFVIAFALGLTLAFIWLAKTGHRDDILYRIHFAESVSGLSLGDPVKLRGVEVGTVRALAIDNEDPRLVKVDIELRKDAPVKVDTKATLKMKGITGGQYIELDGGTPNTPRLAEVTPAGKVPEIPYQKSQLTSIVEKIPQILDKFSVIETKAAKVLNDVGAATGHI